MSQSGYVTIERKLFAEKWWTEKPFTKGKAMVDLVQRARYADGTVTEANGREVAVYRGDVTDSERFLAERWGWYRNKLRRWVVSLVERGTVEEMQRGTRRVLHLVNYDAKQRPWEAAENDTTDRAENGTTNDTTKRTGNGTTKRRHKQPPVGQLQLRLSENDTTKGTTKRTENDTTKGTTNGTNLNEGGIAGIELQEENQDPHTPVAGGFDDGLVTIIEAIAMKNPNREKRETRVRDKTDEMKAVEMLIKQRESTKWKVSQVRAFNRLDIDPEDMLVMQTFYTDPAYKGRYQRSGLSSLLNHWEDAVTHARAQVEIGPNPTNGSRPGFNAHPWAGLDRKERDWLEGNKSSLERRGIEWTPEVEAEVRKQYAEYREAEMAKRREQYEREQEEAYR